MNCSSVYWIHEGMPYVDESKLKKCGCGGSPIVDFLFDYETKQFIDASITCKECGMTTQLKDDIDEVIKVWNKAFSEDYSEYHDHVCLGCSGNFGKEEYY
jgi:hypothetical protein